MMLDELPVAIYIVATKLSPQREVDSIRLVTEGTYKDEGMYRVTCVNGDSLILTPEELVFLIKIKPLD